MNPYYEDLGELGVEKLVFEKEADYDFDIIMFLSFDGKVFCVQDSGCSCPTPFEDYYVASKKDVEQNFERIGDVEQGLRIFDNWRYESEAWKQELVVWLKSKLNNKIESN